MVKPATDRRTFVQYDRSTAEVSLIAELDEGQSTATFADLVPDDYSITLNDNGSATVTDGSGTEAGTVEKPWAYDASGRSLPTHYVLAGTGLVQHVDTDGATFPVIADPRVTAGWYYIYPVWFVEMSWSETWKLKSAVENNWSAAPALLCAYIPNTTARVVCGGLWIGIRQDVINTVRAALNAGKCYKARLPAHAGGAAFVAYDSYYLTCKS
ncbi:hypothetical protein [Fodinibacter luteus]|uniref:hypothetical protein n=1 Tax=Fodinibacter luteus TaxID=552064 RepID=UPI0031EDA5D8